MEVFSYGPDWYTSTNVLYDQPEQTTLFHVFQEMSGPQRRWTGGGYKGNECVNTGLKYGSRPRRDGGMDEMIVASGRVSEKAIEFIGDAARFRTTRFDLQITLHLDQPDKNLAVDLYESIRKKQDVGLSPIGNRNLGLIRSGTGDTLYLGSRSSTRRFFRLYDKSGDLGQGLGEFWRAEVQYGRSIAGGAMEWYLSRGNHYRFIVDLVCSEFYDAMGWSPFPDYTFGVSEFQDEPEEPQSLSKKLSWLEICVRPTVGILIEAGQENEVRKALGLPADWQARIKKAVRGKGQG